MLGRVLIGLDMFYIVEVLKDIKSEFEFLVLEELSGVVSMKFDLKFEIEIFYVDNGVYVQLSSLGDIDGEMEVVDLFFDMQVRIFGKMVEKGIYFFSVDDRLLEIVLGFCVKILIGGYCYYWVLKGKLELVLVEYKMEEGKLLL